MRFQANMAVRLRANSELLLIDSVDEESAIAFCRRIGSAGPEGTPTAYPLDSLRENVVRASRTQDVHHEPSLFRRMFCVMGLHGWKRVSFGTRPPLGTIEGETCAHCGEIRLLSGGRATTSGTKVA
jgi:hypothetical protein